MTRKYLKSLSPKERSELVEEVARLRQEKMPWAVIARFLGGYSEESIRSLVDMDYADSRRIKKRRYGSNWRRNNPYEKSSWRSAGTMISKIDPATIAARRAEIPDDCRTPAQRLLGDPIPARSALARVIPTTPCGQEISSRAALMQTVQSGIARV